MCSQGKNTTFLITEEILNENDTKKKKNFLRRVSNYEALSTTRVFKARSSLAHTFSDGVRMRQKKKK